MAQAPASSPLASASPGPTGAAAGADGCALGDLFRVLGKTHMLDILHGFLAAPDRPRRFVEIHRALGISPNTLSERLKELVEGGLLTRTAFHEIPPRVDYALTPKALDLGPVFATLTSWAARHSLAPAETS